MLITKYNLEDNIKITLKVIELEGLDWIHSAQDNKLQAVVNTVLNPSRTIKYLRVLDKPYSYQLSESDSVPCSVFLFLDRQ